MNVTEYVARGLGDPYIGVPGVIVGGETAMDTRDGDATYVEFYVPNGQPQGSFSIAEWVPIAGPTPPPGATFTKLEMVAEFRKAPGHSDDQSAGFLLALHGLLRGLGTTSPQADDSYQMTPGPDDITTMAVSGGSTVEDDTLAAWPGALPGHIGWQLTSFEPNFRAVHAVRITYLRVLASWEGDTYLRNHRRDDGLGANPPRNRQVTSQQRSLRNRSYR